MKNFKEMLDKDLDSTFYNTEEFAQVRRIKIDGLVLDIPVIFDRLAAKAAGVGSDVIEHMSIRDFNRIKNKSRDFLISVGF